MQNPFIHDCIFIKDSKGKGILRLKKSRIFFAKSSGNDSIIVTIDKKKFTTHETFTTLAQQLCDDRLRRIHRQYIIRPDDIFRICSSDNYVVLYDEFTSILKTFFTGADGVESIPIGKEYMEGLIAAMERARNLQLALDF